MSSTIEEGMMLVAGETGVLEVVLFSAVEEELEEDGVVSGEELGTTELLWFEGISGRRFG
jgi:hypothetical protein